MTSTYPNRMVGHSFSNQHVRFQQLDTHHDFLHRAAVPDSTEQAYVPQHAEPVEC